MIIRLPTQWVVLSGPPGSGKTTLLTALKARGFRTVPEAARTYLTDPRSRREHNALRSDQLAFQRKLVSIQAEAEALLRPEEMYFLDRALPDALGYYRVAGLDTAELAKLILQYRYRQVFLLEPVDGVEMDPLRSETAEHRRDLAAAIAAAYKELGFRPVTVPMAPVDARANFVLRNL